MCEDLYFWVSVKTGERFETPNPRPFWILCETELQRKKPSVSDSYPWLLQSLDEPEPANVSRIKTEPDRQTQEFCHSVCHPFASEPNLCRSQKPPRWWGERNILRVNVRLCNSSKCHSSWNIEDVSYSGAPGAFKSFHYCLMRCAAGSPWKHKTHQQFHRKGYEVLQQDVLPGASGLSRAQDIWCDLICRNTKAELCSLFYDYMTCRMCLKNIKSELIIQYYPLFKCKYSALKLYTH